MRKNYKFYIFYFFIIIVLVEIFSFILFKTKPYNNLTDEVFNKLTYNNNHSLGWEAYNGNPRPSDSDKKICGYAFGDSFIHGDEVNNNQTFIELLSKKNNCFIANYGVDGYGLDQAYLKMQKIIPHSKETKIIIFGIYQEMLRRNMAASWVFYCCPDSLKSIKPYFNFDKKNKKVIINKIPKKISAINIKEHHINDRFYLALRASFPYSLSLLKYIYIRVNKFTYNNKFLTPSKLVFKDTEAVDLSLAIMKKISFLARERGYKLIFLYIPKPSEINDENIYFDRFVKQAKKNIFDPNLIHINLKKQLAKINSENISAPRGHYNEHGNILINDIIDDSINFKLNL